MVRLAQQRECVFHLVGGEVDDADGGVVGIDYENTGRRGRGQLLQQSQKEPAQKPHRNTVILFGLA
jgi:hypothetical protein